MNLMNNMKTTERKIAIGIEAKSIGQTLAIDITFPYQDYPPIALDTFFCKVSDEGKQIVFLKGVV